MAHDASAEDGCRVEDFGERVVMPGVIDAHVHVNEPGRTEWEGFQSATRAAAAGGVTTLIDMPLNSSPVTVDSDALSLKRAAATANCHVNVGFYGGLIPGKIDQLDALLAESIHGVKVFLCDSGIDEFPKISAADLREAMPRIKAANSRLLVHAELTSIAPPVLHVQEYEEYLASRPTSFERNAITLMISLCEQSGCPVHIVHLATAGAVSDLMLARDRGLPITVETCPHYLHFASEYIEKGRTELKCAPPIREMINRERLWQALSAGHIDFIASDHSPCPPAMKNREQGDFVSAWGGISSLQVMLPVVWTGAKRRGASLEMITKWLSQSPAEQLGFRDCKGRIEAGYDADLVVWDAAQTFVVKPEEILHRHKLTPYSEETLLGVVEATYVGGVCVFDRRRSDDERFLGSPVGEIL